VDHAFLHNAVEMPLVQRDHEVETVSSQSSNNAFTDDIRHGRPHGRFEHAQTHMTHPLIHVGGENGVTVMNQYAVRVIDRDRFPELLHGPLRSRMRGDIDMHQSAAGMLDDDKDKVAGCTTVNTCRQSNQPESQTRIKRIARVARRSFTWRS
jgi:hypothetical protein